MMKIDSFLFNDEFDILKIRLEYLNSHIDKFYIAEAPITHAGDKKELLFKKNSHLFKKYLHKIEYIEVCKDGIYSDKEDLFGLPNNKKSSSIVTTSRTELGRFMAQTLNNATIHYSDVDEIPVISKLKKCKDENLYLLSGSLYYYFCNLKCTDFPLDRMPWGIIFNSKTFSDEITLTYYRNLVFQIQARYYGSTYQYSGLAARLKLFKEIKYIESTYKLKVLRNSCYHFSYLGGAEAVMKKISATCHTELSSTVKDLSIDDFSKIINNKRDVYGRELNFKLVNENFDIETDIKKLIPRNLLMK